MAYTTMSKQQRTICEFLKLNPNSTNAEICKGTGFSYESVKKKLHALKDSGHVAGSESKYRALYWLTGKEFPRAAEYQPNPVYVARKARMVRRVSAATGVEQLYAAMHAMVCVGRAAA